MALRHVRSHGAASGATRPLPHVRSHGARLRDHMAPAPVGHNLAMEEVFGTVLFAVVIVASVVAVVTLAMSRDAYREIGRGGLDMERRRPSAPAAPSSPAERDAEIRQMLQARNERRARRGHAPLDVDAEVARLTSARGRAEVDPALREEVREMVRARNARRARRGQPPLDVEVEMERQLRDLG